MKSKKTFLMIFIFSIFLISLTFVSAQPPFQQSDITTGLVIETGYPTTHKIYEDYFVHAHVFNSTDGLLVNNGLTCDYHFYNHQINGGEHISIGVLEQYGAGYNATVNGSLINETGEYSTLIWCNSTDVGGFFKYTFDVSLDGTNVEQPDLFSRIFLIVFVVFLGYVIAGFKKGTDLEKWNKNLIKKYENRNYVKFAFGSLWYNILKNTYVIYYVLGLFLITLIYDVGFMFNVESILGTLEIVLSVYIWGLVLLGIAFVSNVQEWFMDILKQLEDNSWGMNG